MSKSIFDINEGDGQNSTQKEKVKKKVQNVGNVEKPRFAGVGAGSRVLRDDEEKKKKK